jgi:hypothetical protein
VYANVYKWSDAERKWAERVGLSLSDRTYIGGKPGCLAKPPLKRGAGVK